jgi:asparagine synthase (glutamine-hydrolysing)
MCGIVASVGLPIKQDAIHNYVDTNGHTTGPTRFEPKNQANCCSFLNKNGDTRNNFDNNCHALAKNLQAGLNNIKHRGPDGHGVWISRDARVGLGHCRLSINDLSPSGSQPLHSDCGEIHAIVNGEIYDVDRLRQKCISDYGYKFHGESDSELVLALYKIHGTPSFFEHLRGEFSFVLYDDRNGSRRVIAARDRFGIKPLVYTTEGDRVLIGSEAKGLVPLGWKPEWNVRAIMDCGWMADDRTVFKNVKKLMPGHWMDLTHERGFEIKQYWSTDYEDKARWFLTYIDVLLLMISRLK